MGSIRFANSKSFRFDYERTNEESISLIRLTALQGVINSYAV
jgi:hypothetical protein